MGDATPLVFSLPEYQGMAAEIARIIDADLGAVERREFPDGERYQRIETEIDDRDVIVVGGTVSDGATLALFDVSCALVKNGARSLTLVIPYFGYSTMERAVKPREVVTAKTRCRLLSAIPPASFGNRVLLLDLHSDGIPHYLEGGMTAVHVYGKSVLLPVIRELGGERFVVGSTDAGRAKWVESLANELGVEAAFIIKTRVDGGETRVRAVHADVDSVGVVIYDDMIRTGGSLLNAARAYRKAGAERIAAVCTHGIFPGDAFARLRGSGLFEAIVATDSHPRAQELAAEGLRVVAVAAAFAPFLRR